MRKQPLVSIVVPAHNEEAVIAATLLALLSGTEPCEFDVIVVANACSDRTADAARLPGVRVVETAVRGKPNALRSGDAVATAFPRLYLDADVTVTATSVRAMVSACAMPGVLACAPVPILDLDRVGPVARRVHRVHDHLMAPVRALAGAGAYMLTEAGHDRVFPIPDVISDDGLVHASFTPSERVVVSAATSLIRPSRSVRAHLNRRVRVRRGNQQLAALGRSAGEGRRTLGDLGRLLVSRRISALDGCCYLAVLVLDRAVTRLRSSGDVSWGHDVVSRLPGSGNGASR